LVENAFSDLCNNERVVRQRIILLIKGNLTKHAHDGRYQHQTSRERIAASYFCMVNDFLNKFQMYDLQACNKLLKLEQIKSKWENEELEKRGILSTLQSPSADDPHHNSSPQWKTKSLELEHARKQLADAKMQLYEESKRIKNEKQSLYVSMVWVLKNMNRKVLKEWFRTEDVKKKQNMLCWIQNVITTFEYEGKESIEKRAEIGAETSTTKTLSDAKNRLESMYTNLEKRGLRNQPGNPVNSGNPSTTSGVKKKCT